MEATFRRIFARVFQRCLTASCSELSEKKILPDEDTLHFHLPENDQVFLEGTSLSKQEIFENVTIKHGATSSAGSTYMRYLHRGEYREHEVVE